MEWTVQGQRAYAYTGGKPFDPALPCVVFVHGAQNDHSVWGLQTRWFAHHGFSVLAVDLPAHGRSAGAPLATVEAMADWVMALAQAAGVDRPAMVVGDDPINKTKSVILTEEGLRESKRLFQQHFVTAGSKNNDETNF